MFDMIRSILVLACLLSSIVLCALDEKPDSYPWYNYDVAEAHQIKPHRRIIRFEGVRPGPHELTLRLIVSPTGDVLNAKAGGDEEVLKFWPQLEGEVRQWKYVPFEKYGSAVTAEIQEAIYIVPPERLPQNHVDAPVLRPNSKVTITLKRSGPFYDEYSYAVTASTSGIRFEGHRLVAALGVHTAKTDADEIRELASKFVTADFYSMDSLYSVKGKTGEPTYILSIAIDGHTKQVEDHAGWREGMPAFISELEDKVDAVARTQRWIAGGEGLVEALQQEGFNFHTVEAQVMLKEAARRGKITTMKEFLAAGVPLRRLPAPKPVPLWSRMRCGNDARPYPAPDPLDGVADEIQQRSAVGWLTAAGRHPEALQVLMDAGASQYDHKDKDLALAGAARSGKVEAVRALIADGANPNADLSRQWVGDREDGFTTGGPGAGSILIYAAKSGNPEMVREILGYRPNLEKRDSEGKTALFAAAEFLVHDADEDQNEDDDDERAESVRLLAQAGADVNARDNHGNTPLHRTFITRVEEELLNLGADVNARNNNGETPIFTTVDRDAIPLFIEHGADLTIRNNRGESVTEAARKRKPDWQETLFKAIQKLNQL